MFALFGTFSALKSENYLLKIDMFLSNIVSTSILTRTFVKEIGAMFGVANRVLVLVIIPLAETERTKEVERTILIATKNTA